MSNLSKPDSAAYGQYEAAGWTQWPDHPELSLQFLRTLGAAQEGGSTIGECFLAASRMQTGDVESWHREWQRLAGICATRAEAATEAGHIQTAKANWLRAANYYRSSEFYLAPSDPRRLVTFDAIESCSHRVLELMSPKGEIVRIDLPGGGHLDAYFVKPCTSADRLPVIIAFGGLDEYKDELLHEMPKHAFARGMALLLVDLPGQGGSLRRQGMPTRPDSHVPVGKCIDYLEGRKDVDPARIALYGASLGGVYSARAAAFEHRVRCVVSDSLVFDLHDHMLDRTKTPNALIWMHLKWVFGAETMDGVVEKCAAFNLDPVLGQIACPYLIVQGAHDFLGLGVTDNAAASARAKGVQVTYKIFSAEETGASHCQVDNPTLGQEYICDWIAEQLGINERQLATDGISFCP